MYGISGSNPWLENVMFTFNVPAGATQLAATLTGGTGDVTLVSYTNPQGSGGDMDTDGGPTMVRPVVAGKTYYFNAMPTKIPGSYSNFTLTGYAQ
ncbi:hypothetical protein [Paraburkholderia adhaesiva]|uniref:hypothetical protein n=1 Tax=Paraburkholderia adhaesiva TaxID=2883244 RepID=UPI001F2CF22C|nr:hypothetical protein [Paraburkholderia adhaesiva]